MSGYGDFLPSLRLQPTLAVSPDGSHVAYVDDADGQFNVVVQALEGGPARRLTAYADRTVRRVAWHPGGKSVVFLADRNGDENTQVYRVDLSGESEALTDRPDVQYATALGDPFSPDGRLLAYSGNDRVPTEQDILVRDLATGEVRRLYAAGGRVYAGHWAPDGARLSAADWREGNSDHVAYLVPTTGEKAARLTPDAPIATYWLGPWLPDGSGFLVRSNAGREFTGLGIMPADAAGLASAGPAVTWLDTPDSDVEEAALSADGRVLVWSVNVDGASQLRARDLTSGADLAVPTLPAGVVSDLTVTPDASRVVMRLSTPTLPWNIVLLDLATGELRWLTDSGPVAADPARFVEPELIRYPGREGRDIPAFLYRPAATSATVGVVLAIHGGPAAQERPTYGHDGFYQYLLSRGVAVLAPNVRGSTGYGKSYKALSHRDWGGGDLDDFADAVRYLHRQPWVDPTRIGLYGGSYGGFAVLSCLARLPELDWAAAVDVCGPSNLLTFARAAPPTWRSKVAVLVGDPDTDAELLNSRSPVRYADAIRAPLFVIQGANDPRVPKDESDQIVEHLRARGVEVRYDVYPDEGHGFTRRENQARARADAADFLLAHLTR